MLNFVSGAKYWFLFACMTSCKVYDNFQNCIDIALFRILYIIEYFVSFKNGLCLLNRYNDTHLSKK